MARAERQAQMLSTKYKQEESDLEKTSLRARVRNLEAELEATSSAKNVLEVENSRLRAVIQVSRSQNIPIHSV